MIPRRLLPLCVLCLAFSVAADASAQWYVTDLGPNVLPTAINANGQIVGAVSTSNLGSALPDYGSQYGGLAAGLTIPGTAFLWSNGTMSNLGGVPAGYANINAFGINASGTIVGNATDILGNDYAFVYSGGSWQALGGNMYTANGINDDGVIVGQTSGSGAYVLSGGVGGTQMNIGGMGAAYAINNSGVVVGGANNPINPNGGNAPQYYNGSLTSYNSSALYGVNDETQGPDPDGRLLAIGPGPSGSALMGGMVFGNSGPVASFYTVAAGTTTGPSTWPRTSGSNYTTTVDTAGLYGIDSEGNAVGSAGFKSTKYSDGIAVPATQGSGHLGAFLFTAAGAQQDTDLNTYIPSTDDWVLQCARAITVVGDVPDGAGVNHAGEEWIVGFGIGPDGQEDGFLLTPTAYTPALPGDANSDGRVDINDLTVVLAHYDQTGMTWSQGEFTGDGTVDINDLTIVLAHYGQTYAAGAPSAAVPEPGALVTLAIGLIGLLAWARRTGK